MLGKLPSNTKKNKQRKKGKFIPTIRLAQSILKHKFPPVDMISPSKWAFEKYKSRGLFLEFHGVGVIRNRTSERSERVRLLIQKQRVRKYPTKHFPCGIVFIIYILTFKFFFIVFNDRPRQNSVTRIQVKNSCKDYNISLNFCQKFNITLSK